jgi:PAS domain S-box-containing protein
MMNLRKKTTLIICANLLTLVMTFMANAADAKDPLIFAGDMNYPPFESIQGDQPTGLNVDILRALSEAMDRDIEIRLIKWSDAQQMLMDEKADALTEMAYSESRAELYDFSEQTVLYKYSFFVKKDDEFIHHIADAEGKTIAVTEGGYPRQLLKSNKKIKLYLMKNNLDGFKLLLAGDVDAVATDYWVGAYTLEENNLTSVITFDARTFAEKPGFIPVKKGNTALLNEINQGIAKLRKEGAIQKILDKWSGKSLVFMTKDKLENLTTMAGIALVLLIILCAVVWIYALRKQLKSRTAELQKAYDNLEVKVQERTISLQREIADHKKTVENLQKSEVRFRAVFDQAAVGVARVAPDGAWLEVNERLCGIVGYSREELLAKTFQEITHPDDLQSDLGYINQLLGNQINSYSMEKRYFKKNGDTVWINLTVTLARKPDGTPLFFISVIEDISVRKEVEEKIRKLNEELEQKVTERTAQLQISNKDLEAFAYSVSHDLRAPLRAISGYSQMLIEDYGEKLDAEGQRLLDVVCDNAEDMGRLIDGLLAFSRLGSAEMKRSSVDMETLVQEAFATLQKNDESTSAKLIIKPLPEAAGDWALFSTVFTNLLSNAIKFAKPGQPATIEVTGSVEGNENLYSVKDNGVGFDMKYVDKMFQVFQRLHSVKDFAGTGIGLALVQRIIQRSGGRVWAEGEVDKGATIYFTLPREEELKKKFNN